MAKRKISIIFFLYAIILFSCASENDVVIPVPPVEYFVQEKEIINADNITETKNGSSARNLPAWLAAYINSGVEGVERIYAYSDKYVFIAKNDGVNLAALQMWADNFSTVRDFTVLSAQRIQKRMILSAAYYPDDEYGVFFETMIKSAYSTIYPDASKDDTYWIKLNNSENISESGIVNGPSEIYNYFILITVNKTAMQEVISAMMEEASTSVTPNGSQSNAINRLRQTFFTGF